MGAVDTTYTFTATDTITSGKMNNIIDQTTITTDAIIGTTLDIASGKLKIRSSGITSNEMGANSVVAAAITDSNVTTAKIADANITQAKLASNVVGNGPAFSAYASTTTSIPNNTPTKINLVTEDHDTNNNYNTSGSRFTPSVAGYYQISASVYGDPPPAFLQAMIYKNGSLFRGGSHINGQIYQSNTSALVYLNGSTDYIELYATHAAGGAITIPASAYGTFMTGFLARSA